MTLFQAFGQFAGQAIAAPSGGIVTITPSSVASDGSASIGGNGLITFSSTQTLNVNGVFSSEYTIYAFDLRIECPTTSISPDLRLRASGSDNSTASSYIRQQLYAVGTSVGGSRVTSDKIRPASVYTTLDTNYYTGKFYGPALAEPTAMRSDGVASEGNTAYYAYGGTHNQSTAYDGFSLLTSADVQGELMIYGMVS